MTKRYFSFSILLMMLVNTAAFPQRKAIKAIEWKRIAILPGKDEAASIGLAGAIHAVSGKAMIIAGGANFPGKMPWEGGKKHYSDEIHVLHKKNGKYSWNKNITSRLPEPIAYCGNTSTPMGVVYAGGENDAGLSDKTFLLTVDLSTGKIGIRALPSLPSALTNISLTNIGNVVYAVGGDGALLSSSRFFSLNLASGATRWDILPDLPAALSNAVVLTQNGLEGINIYVIGGRSKHPSGISVLRSSLYIYEPGSRTWHAGAPVSDGEKIMNFSAGTGVAVSGRYLLVMGGDDGEVFHQIETYLSRISKAATAREKAELTAAKNQLVTRHQGFYRGILVYDTHTNSWGKIGTLPFPARVTTTAALWGKHIVLSNGEVRPGVRTADVTLGSIK